MGTVIWEGLVLKSLVIKMKWSALSLLLITLSTVSYVTVSIACAICIYTVLSELLHACASTVACSVYIVKDASN